MTFLILIFVSLFYNHPQNLGNWYLTPLAALCHFCSFVQGILRKNIFHLINLNVLSNLPDNFVALFCFAILNYNQNFQLYPRNKIFQEFSTIFFPISLTLVYSSHNIPFFCVISRTLPLKNYHNLFQQNLFNNFFDYDLYLQSQPKILPPPRILPN